MSGRRKKENILDTQLLEEVGYLAKIPHLKSVNSSMVAVLLEEAAQRQFGPISQNLASFSNQQLNLYH